MADASLADIREFFGFTSVSEFSAEWRALSAEAKEFFKAEVGKAIGK